MASPGGTSSGSSMLQNSVSEEDLQLLIDQRKRKRMLSNRESARRSRLRKQKHLDDLMAQVAQLRKENGQIMNDLSVTSQHYMNVEAENSVLRAQVSELSHRLQSLNDIIGFMNISNGGFDSGDSMNFFDSNDNFVNPMNWVYVNQPIIASADNLLQY
ncbi:Basic-leucine zipper domain [Dillenia turbinata]|uniref:Basic-leucine zipper domain n=1 Tax=Dillenia turbinata TaxID=194707 RepID=A0AAN8ZQV9_9MAGN